MNFIILDELFFNVGCPGAIPPGSHLYGLMAMTADCRSANKGSIPFRGERSMSDLGLAKPRSQTDSRGMKTAGESPVFSFCIYRSSL